MKEDEETDYRTAQELTRYWTTPDRDAKSDGESKGVQVITAPTLQQPVVAPVNQVKWGNRLKKTYRALEGSPLVRSKGEGSKPQLESPQPEKPQPDSQPEPQQPERFKEDEDEKP